MSASLREAWVAAQLTQMRTALTRVELLAGEIAREALTPRSRASAAAIRGAVDEVDARIERLFELLTASARGPAVECDLRPLLASLRARWSPALEARGVGWVELNASEPVCGDPDLLREGLALLLGEALEALGEGVELRVALLGERQRYGVRVEVAGADAIASGAAPRSVLDRFALAHGAAIERTTGSHGRTLRLLLPRAGVEACTAS